MGSRLTASGFQERVAQMPDLQIVDVRNPGEVADGTIADAITIPVGQLPDRIGELDVTRPTVVYGKTLDDSFSFSTEAAAYPTPLLFFS